MEDFKQEILKPQTTENSADVTMFGASPENPNNYAAFQKALDYCKQNGIHTLTLPHGIYKMCCEKPLLLDGLCDFTLDGQGSEIIFSRSGNWFYLQNCERLHLKELAIDWDWEKEPLATVVEAVGVSPDKTYADFRLIDRKTLDLAQKWVTLNAVDPFTLTPGCEDGLEFGAYKNDTESFSEKEYLGDGIYRCYRDLSAYGAEKFQKGRFYIVRHYLYNGVVFEIADSCHVTFENVVIYSGTGHGFVVTGHSHHLYFNRCRIQLRPGTNRHITTTADGCHIAQSNGYLLFENCDFGYQGDDCINIHDNVRMFMHRIDEKTLQIKRGMPFESGNSIEFRNADLSPTGVCGIVESVSYTETETILTFQAPLPDLKEDVVLYNRAYGSHHYIIRGCHFHETRARGVLLQANDGLVENCRFFKIQGAAIQIETGASRTWSEGMGVDNVIIRNNVIVGCDANDWGKAVLYMSTFLPYGVPIKPHGSDNPTTTLGDSGSSFRPAYPMFTNITIEGNIFAEYPRRAMILSSFDGVTVKNNIFTNKQSRRHNNPERGSIWVEMGKHIAFQNNFYDQNGYNTKELVEYDPETMQGEA